MSVARSFPILFLLVGCSSRSVNYDFLASDAAVRSDAQAGTSAPSDETLIYAHSATTLYRYDRNAFTEVAPFSFAEGTAALEKYINDIAVNQDGEIYGVSLSTLYRIDANTARASSVGRIASRFLNALTFVEAGTIDPDQEVLIAMTASGDVVRIDPTTGASRSVGTLPDRWRASGDLVSATGAGTYAALLVGGDCDAASPGTQLCDHLTRLEFDRFGTVTEVHDLGPIHQGGMVFDKVYGLGYWGSTLYGFTEDGALLRIRRDNAEATVDDTVTGGIAFFGAGVTTRAYVIP